MCQSGLQFVFSGPMKSMLCHGIGARCLKAYFTCPDIFQTEKLIERRLLQLFLQTLCGLVLRCVYLCVPYSLEPTCGMARKDTELPLVKVQPQQKGPGGITVQAFLERMSDRVRIDSNFTGKHDIDNSVKELITRLMKSIVTKDTRFESSLIETGSSYDGTKISSPNEYDYLAVMTRFSNENCVRVMRVCHNNRGFAHVQLRDNIGQTWTDLVTDSRILVTKHFRDRFRFLCHETINERRFEGTIESPTGSLSIEGYDVSINGPQCNVKLKWRPVRGENITISVDVCPTISYSRLEDVLQAKDTANQFVYKTMLTFKHVHLIPRPQSECRQCFKLVFAEADRRVIEELSDSHKRCLLILKCIASKWTERDGRLNKFFNSFALKMAVLHHSYICDTKYDIQHCIVGILGDLKRRLEEPVPMMPSVFINKHNVWGNLFQSGKAVDVLRLNTSVSLLKSSMTFFQMLPSRFESEHVCDQKFKDFWKLCRYSFRKGTRLMSITELID